MEEISYLCSHKNAFYKKQILPIIAFRKKHIIPKIALHRKRKKKQDTRLWTHCLKDNTVIEYLNHLNDSKLLALIYSDNTSVKKMQKPDKIYLDNPNMLYAMATTPVKIGTARECFVVNQLSHRHKVEYGKEHGDFKIDGKWTVEVGGEGKSFAQIADMPNSFVLADDIEMPRGSKIPLWMIGMTY